MSLSDNISIATETTMDEEEEDFLERRRNPVSICSCDAMDIACGAMCSCPYSFLKRVTFAENVSIIRIPIAVGNECTIVLSGPHEAPHPIMRRNFELFEYCRSDARRRGEDLFMDKPKRISRLLKAGYSEEEVAAACKTEPPKKSNSSTSKRIVHGIVKNVAKTMVAGSVSVNRSKNTVLARSA